MSVDYAPEINAELLQLANQYPNQIVDYALPWSGTVLIGQTIKVPPHKYGIRVHLQNAILKPITAFNYALSFGHLGWGSGNISQWAAYNTYDFNPASAGATSITIPSLPGTLGTLPAYVMLYDLTVDSVGGYYVHQEMAKVTAYVPGTGVATLEEGLARDYVTVTGNKPRISLIDYSSAQGYSVDGGGFDMRDATTNAQCQQAVQFTACYNPLVQGVSVTGCETDAFRFDFCRHVTVDQVKTRDSYIQSTGGLGRAVLCNNSVDCNVTKSSFRDGRHAVSISVGTVLSRISDCYAYNHIDAAWDGNHGLLANDTGFTRCYGGYGQFGNGTYIDGGVGGFFTDCVLDNLLFIGAVSNMTVTRCRMQTVNFQGADTVNLKRPTNITLASCSILQNDPSFVGEPVSIIGIPGTPTGALASVNGVTFSKCTIVQSATGGGRRCFGGTVQTLLNLTVDQCQLTNPGTGTPMRWDAGTPAPTLALTFTNNQIKTGSSYAVELGAGTSGAYTITGNKADTVGGSTLLNSGTAAGPLTTVTPP